MPRKAAPPADAYERSTPEIEQPLDDDLVPVISRRISNVWLSYYDDSTVAPENAPDDKILMRGVGKVLILPGLNYRSRTKLEKCGPLGSGNVRLEARHPTEVSEHDARELIKMTTSKDALRRWREAETRPQILAELDKRLHGAA